VASKSSDRQTILITGATGFVGVGLAAYFSGQGARVLLCGRSEERLRELLARTKSVAAYAADLCDADSLVRLAAQLQAEGRTPDIVINNAADVTSLPLLESSLEDIDRIIRTNVIGTLQLCRLIVPAMIAEGGGSLVTISSLAGYKPNPTQTVYGVSKAALNAMSEALRAELSGRGIHVLNVAMMSVGEGKGRIPVEVVGRRIEDAIERKRPELFFYARTKWLMRLYGMFPGLMRPR
jgi:short-subunit dehydrogenase